MKDIYLDNSATTMTTPEAAQAVARMLLENYGNPSSLHTMGIKAERAIVTAKDSIAGAIGASGREIVFTSGGTESNNLAVFGAVQAKKRLGNRIVTTQIEHPSVYDAIGELEARGFEVVRLHPDAAGNIDAQRIANEITSDTILVSIMLVNNETGVVLPVQAAKQAMKQVGSKGLLHCDAVQGFGKIPVKALALGADLMSLSAHKIHGPKGVGALYIAGNARIVPLFFGGGQQNGIRPGTESTPLIAGFGVAASQIDISRHRTHAAHLRDVLVNQLKSVPGIRFNSPVEGIPDILNVSVPHVRSETMLHYLAQNGIYVSSGSACARGRKSRTLTAMGLDDGRIDSAIRISFSRYNSQADINALAEGLRSGIKKLSGIK